MARTHERIIALVIALLFFGTAVGTGAVIIWDVVKNKKDNTAVDTSSDASNTTNQNASSKPKLEGTQLANFTPVAKIDKLTYVDTTVGTGEEVAPGATVTVDYTGAVAATGKIFQSSLDTGSTVKFPLGQVIDGWKDGVPGMKVGGTRRLMIPAAQAYGSHPPDGIPVNADLVFDITLHAISK